MTQQQARQHLQQVTSSDHNREDALRGFWLKVCDRAEAVTREMIEVTMLLNGQENLALEVRHDA